MCFENKIKLFYRLELQVLLGKTVCSSYTVIIKLMCKILN